MKASSEVMTAEEAATFLKAHVETLRRLARRGEIPAFKVGKDWRFQKELLVRWAEQHHLRNSPPDILVVEDDQNVRELLANILRAEGYVAHLATDGESALDFLRNTPVNLILLDLVMPKMSGAELLRQLKELGHRPPVIVVTGYPDSDLVHRAMEYGPLTLIAKPVHVDTLMLAVRTVLRGGIVADQQE